MPDILNKNNNNTSCPASKEDLKKGLELLWKNVLDSFVSKKDFNGIKEDLARKPVVVVSSKDEIKDFRSGILYIVNKEPFFYDSVKGELVALVDSGNAELKKQLEDKILETFKKFEDYLDSSEFINDIQKRLPIASPTQNGLFSKEDRAIFNEMRLSLLTRLDEDEVKTMLGSLKQI